MRHPNVIAFAACLGTNAILVRRIVRKESRRSHRYVAVRSTTVPQPGN
jgi:hypothetical protein